MIVLLLKNQKETYPWEAEGVFIPNQRHKEIDKYTYLEKIMLSITLVTQPNSQNQVQFVEKGLSQSVQLQLYTTEHESMK